MNIFKATADFERWLAKRLPVVRQDIALKHKHMAEAAFPFFRATFCRWLQLWPEVCPELAKAPSVLAVGDLHIENFGTGATKKAGSSGESTTSTKPGPPSTRSI
jgi:uncharacterized protein (DUF2252 family)